MLCVSVLLCYLAPAATSLAAGCMTYCLLRVVPCAVDGGGNFHSLCAPHIIIIAAAIVPMQLASGEVYGKDQPVTLQLLGSERSREALEGVAMELEDSLYPLLREVRVRWGLAADGRGGRQESEPTPHAAAKLGRRAKRATAQCCHPAVGWYTVGKTLALLQPSRAWWDSSCGACCGGALRLLPLCYSCRNM